MQWIGGECKIDRARIEELAAELISDDVAALLVAKAVIRKSMDWKSKFFWLQMLVIALSAITSYIEEEMKRIEK
jgi:hypothetical protein